MRRDGGNNTVFMPVFRSLLNEILSRKDYQNYITDRTILEKRKLLSLLLAVFTDASANDLTQMKIENLEQLLETQNTSISNKNINITKEALDYLIEDLYSSITFNRDNEDYLFVSIIEKRPLSTINLKRDCNEQIVKLLESDHLKQHKI